MDLDAEIEREQGAPVAEIFKQNGEAAFRAREAAELVHAGTQDPSVVACGGGVVLEPANRITLRNTGVAVFLDVPIELLRERVRPATDRPLIREEGATRVASSPSASRSTESSRRTWSTAPARPPRSPTPSWRSSVGPRDRPDPGAPLRRGGGLGRDRTAGEHLPDLPSAATAFVVADRDGRRAVVRAARRRCDRATVDGSADGPGRRGGQDPAGVRDAAAPARDPGGAPRRRRDRARRGGDGRPRRVRRLDLHAGRAVRPGARPRSPRRSMRPSAARRR